MCINVDKIEILAMPLTVWKVCRHGRGAETWYLSSLPPGRRAPQSGHPATKDWEAWPDLEYGQGKTKKYYVGKTHHSKLPGMYCFTDIDTASHYSRRSWRATAILECIIPAGTRVVYGSAFGDPCVVTPDLKVMERITVSAHVPFAHLAYD